MSAKLIVECPERLAVVREFADRTNQRQQFESRLSDLTAFLPDDWIVKLYSDFAPCSFFWMEFGPTGKLGLIGGLIYHGQHDRGGNGGAPTFSVNLTPTTGWCIHT